MAEGYEFQKLYADIVEHMPLLDIRGKMQDEKPKKFADSQNCTHISFDEDKPPSDREIDIFCDDLFKYLIFRRFDIAEYDSLLQRTPEDPISNFHPYIGMSILCGSYKTQKYILTAIIEDKLEIKNLDAIVNYFTFHAFSVRSSVQYNVFYQLRLLACMALELITFFFLRGHKNAVHYGARLYSATFRIIFKKDFYANGGWKAWKDSIVNDVEYYVKNLLNIADPTTEAITVRRWLSRFDWWIARVSFDDFNTFRQVESTLAIDESHNVYDATHNATHDSEKRPNSASTKSKLEMVRCLSTKDCPEGTKYREKFPCLMLELIEITVRQTDSASKDLLRILQDDALVKELTRYCLFMNIINNLRFSKIKMRNIDILECVKLILKENSEVAVFCFYIVIGMFQELEKKSLLQEDAKGEIHNPRETKTSDIESVKRSSPVKKSGSSLYEKDKKLFDMFHGKIIGNGQFCTLAAANISEILSNRAYLEILADSNVFNGLMKSTIHFENRWDDEWILSVMTFLINNSQTKDVFLEQTSVGGAQNKCLANEVSSVDINPQLNKSVPCSMHQTAQSSLPSTSDLENIEIEQISTDDAAELVKNPHQNMNECRECFNRVNEKLRLVEYDKTG